ncbi:hypothetical protein [Acetobacter oeni]|uniref:DUF937 domain-containing protein n=1 Tax=Acetobacter oeni TaxID=304077 RepID=A0A511XL53_9PROT|nr:hypothetical protein [Acetobacter oeni]MBB3883926.1 uncharacterized protein YidB (DUF937 family) [Acetobacter oeni]NHO19933.1 hypothetical protein [Acetobacter oeni]GBR02507.1 hypothetical protein AA21952_0773 [Acetobacter oeni LMG 21952]GEN63690.1 hypothetical protein AOE01nite_19140 [Acetobacter oeni]
MPDKTNAPKDASVTEAITRVGDTLTAAADDKSGLSSAVIDYMGGEDSVGRRQIRERAERAGLGDTLRRWEHESLPHGGTEEMVPALLTPEEIDRFSAQTGLSRPATVAALAEILPNACRLDHIEDEQKSGGG